MNFTQKYTIVSLLEPQPVEYEFASKNWPLHVTLAATFSIGTDIDSFMKVLTQLSKQYKPLETQVISTAMFGQYNDIPVALVKNTPELSNLHSTIVSEIKTAQGAFNEPRYTLDGYKPHISVTGKTIPDNSVVLNNITLIDMFPNNDPLSRKILLQIQL
jgi:2'-5' RNA ligase